MKIIWYKIRKIKEFFELIIEGDIYPKKIFQSLKNNNNYEKIVIKCFDSEMHDFSVLSKILEDQQIDFFYVPNGIAVYEDNIRKVFEKTDFGESLDCFELFMFAGSDTLTSNEDIFVSFLNIPNLIVRSLSKEILEELLSRIITSE